MPNQSTSDLPNHLQCKPYFRVLGLFTIEPLNHVNSGFRILVLKFLIEAGSKYYNYIHLN